MLYQDWEIELTGDQIRITPMRLDDDEAYGRLMLGDSLYESSLRHMDGQSPTSMEKILSHKGDETHAIRLIDQEDFIGWITLQKNIDGQPDIGISLIADQQNKGYGPEAVMLFVNYLHNEYGLERIAVHISEKDLQSQYAFGKLGVEFDKEVPDERFIFSDQPLSEQEMDSLPKVLYFHIPLPVEKIQPSHNTLSNEEKEKAQSEYNGEYQRLMNQIRLKELDYISSMIRSMDHPTVEDINTFLAELIENQKSGKPLV